MLGKSFESLNRRASESSGRVEVLRDFESLDKRTSESSGRVEVLRDLAAALSSYNERCSLLLLVVLVVVHCQYREELFEEDCS